MSDAPTVGLVGSTDRVDLRQVLADADLNVIADAAPAVCRADPAVVVAVGDRAVADVAACGPAAPVIPVAAGAGIRAVPPAAVDAIPAAIAERDWTTERHRPLSVAVDGESVATAAFDVTLVTAEAARISEFEVRVDGAVIDRSRADGVVIATPAGSTEYARRVDAPVLAPGTGVAVAWIAPFRADPDRWVVEPGALEVSVRREEAAVDLHADERVVRSVSPGHPVAIHAGEPFTVAVLEEGRRRYG